MGGFVDQKDIALLGVGDGWEAGEVAPEVRNEVGDVRWAVWGDRVSQGRQHPCQVRECQAQGWPTRSGPLQPEAGPCIGAAVQKFGFAIADGDQLSDIAHQPSEPAPTTTHSTMPQPRIGGSGSSRRSMNPFTATYNAFVVSENAPIVRSITAFGVS